MKGFSTFCYFIAACLKFLSLLIKLNNLSNWCVQVFGMSGLSFLNCQAMPTVLMAPSVHISARHAPYQEIKVHGLLLQNLLKVFNGYWRMDIPDWGGNTCWGLIKTYNSAILLLPSSSYLFSSSRTLPDFSDKIHFPTWWWHFGEGDKTFAYQHT